MSFGERLKGLFGGGSFKKGEFIVINERQEIKEAIYQEFQSIILSCLYCWNDLPIFIARDYLFSRSGVFPYTAEDEKLMAQIVDKATEKAKEIVGFTDPA